MPLPRLSLVVFLLIGQAQAASPRDALLRYVPDDVGFCAVFTGLPKTVSRLRESPFAAALARTARKDARGIKELQEALKAADTLQAVLGRSWAELPDIIPGEAFIFIYRPGPPGKPQLEQGLFLLRSKDGKALAALVANVNSAFPGVVIKHAEHKGVRYVRRVEKKGETYYLLAGPVLLFTSQEEALKRAIEQEKSLPKGAVPALAKRLAALGLDDAPVAVVVNPRAFDAHLAAGKGKTAEAVAAYWKALAAVGIGLHLDSDATLSLALLGKTSKLPAAGRKWLEADGKASALWGAFPEEPLLVVAGQSDLPLLYAVVCEFMPDDRRKELEAELEKYIVALTAKEGLKELLPALGPDWGLCLLSPPAGSKEASPRSVAAIKLAGDAAAVKKILKLLEELAVVVVVGHNTKAKPGYLARKVQVGEGDAALWYIDFAKAAPPEVRPAWGKRGGYLVLASHPEVVEAFKVGKAALTGDAVLLARASFAAWRKFFKDQRGAVSASMVARDGLSKKQAEAKLDALDDWLALLNRLELRRYQATGRVTYRLRLKFVEPLMKAR